MSERHGRAAPPCNEGVSTGPMGIYSRDYLRDDEGGPRRFGGGYSGNIVKTLIIANVVVFVLQILTMRTVAYQTPLGVVPGP